MSRSVADGHAGLCFSSRKRMKNPAVFARLGPVWSGGIDEPLELLRPENWLIRRVRG